MIDESCLCSDVITHTTPYSMQPQQQPTLHEHVDPFIRMDQSWSTTSQVEPSAYIAVHGTYLCNVVG